MYVVGVCVVVGVCMCATGRVRGYVWCLCNLMLNCINVYTLPDYLLDNVLYVVICSDVLSTVVSPSLSCFVLFHMCSCNWSLCF